jgi:hypothetical protein
MRDLSAAEAIGDAISRTRAGELGESRGERSGGRSVERGGSRARSELAMSPTLKGTEKKNTGEGLEN